jgi:hypothetical protein
MNGEFDAVSIHPYGVWAPDGQNQPTSQEADALAQTIPALETSLQQANNGNPVNLDITETGWNNPQGQENYTPEFINDMSSLPYVTGLDVYDWVDTQGFGVSGTAAQQPTDTALDQFATAGSVASDRGTSS